MADIDGRAIAAIDALNEVGRESEMPLYHFDLVNTKTATDGGGAVLSDDIAPRMRSHDGCSASDPS